MIPMTSQTTAKVVQHNASVCDDCVVRSISVCSALNHGEQRRLTAILTTLACPADETLFSEGQPADAVYNVTSGIIKLYKLLPDGRRQITGFLGAGDFIGMQQGDAYAFSAETVTPATLCRFPRRKIEALLIEFPTLQRRLFSMAANELVAAQDQMLLLGRKRAMEKFCSFLLMQSERARRRGLRDNPVHVPMSRADMADYLGLTMETVSRTVSQLKSRRLITLLKDGRIQLEDIPSLKALAENEA
jgi:CRP/FNR family transcriptional regulator